MMQALFDERRRLEIRDTLKSGKQLEFRKRPDRSKFIEGPVFVESEKSAEERRSAFAEGMDALKEGRLGMGIGKLALAFSNTAPMEEGTKKQ